MDEPKKKCTKCGVEFCNENETQKWCKECQQLQRTELIHGWLHGKEAR